MPKFTKKQLAVEARRLNAETKKKIKRLKTESAKKLKELRKKKKK